MTKQNDAAACVRSILLLDDDTRSLSVVAEMLGHRLASSVQSTRYPSEAFRLATERFYDLVVLDVSLNYRGGPFGGLDLYGELRARYGSASILAYSEVITDAMLGKYPFVENFVDKHTDFVVFADALSQAALELKARQTCFVAMPFAREFDNLYSQLHSAIRNAGYVPVRVDEQHFTNSIVQQVLQEIRRAKVVVFVATDRSPNAFYECGFAVALNKEVVTVTDDLSSLPFDIRDRNAIEYGNGDAQLESALTERLLGLTRSQ